MKTVHNPISNRNHQSVKRPDPIASKSLESRVSKSTLRSREESAEHRARLPALPMKRKIETGKTLYRTAQFDREAINDTARTVRLSISSDRPYLRSDFFGNEFYEVLDHSPGGIVIDRLTDGTALLWNHQANQHLGRQVSFENDGHKITVVSKFSRSPFAEEKWQDVRDGILQNSSVGYLVLDAEETDEEIDGLPVYKMKWQPLEHSLVPIAADISVGVGRSHEPDFKPPQTMETEQVEQQINGRTETQERERITELLAIARVAKLPEEIVQKAIAEGTSTNAFRKYVFENHWGNPKSILTPRSGSADLNGGGTTREGIGAQIAQHPGIQQFFRGGKKTISFELPGISNIRSMGTSDFGGTIQHLGAPVFANQRLTIADLLAAGTTSAGTVRYPRENSFTPSATSVGEAGVKPEQAFDVTPVDEPARKIAAFTRVSTELLQDAPASEAYLSNRLEFAVLREEERQILFGDGLGSNLKGIFTNMGVQTQAKGGDIAPDAIRKAIGNVAIYSDFEASGVVIHPQNWQAIEMLKTTTGEYLVGNIFVRNEMGQLVKAPSIWGLPVVVTKSTPVGTALVGDFARAAQLFRRQGLLIEMSNSDGDNFTRNLVTVLAELRALVATYAPAAFCDVTGL